MTAALRIGDPVQVHETSEVLTLVCLDNGRAWVRDGAGNHIDYAEEDLALSKFNPRPSIYQEPGYWPVQWPSANWTSRGRRP